MSLMKFERPAIRNLGALCSKLYALNRQYEYAAEDIAAFHAPSECYTLACKGVDAEKEKIFNGILEETGLDQNDFLFEVARRGTYKFVYFYL